MTGSESTMPLDSKLILLCNFFFSLPFFFSLSAGTAIVLALGKPADIYLIDEPSAYLDSEQRIITAKVIKVRFEHTHACAHVQARRVRVICASRLGFDHVASA